MKFQNTLVAKTVLAVVTMKETAGVASACLDVCVGYFFHYFLFCMFLLHRNDRFPSNGASIFGSVIVMFYVFSALMHVL